MKKADIQVGEFYGVTSKAKWRGFGLVHLKKGKVVAIGQTADAWRDDADGILGNNLDKQADIVVEYERGQRWAVRPADVRIPWAEVEPLKAENRAKAEERIAAFAAAERRARKEYSRTV